MPVPLTRCTPKRGASPPGWQGDDALLVPTLLTPPPPYGLLDQPRGTTRAFFDVEFATTGWTPLANVTGVGSHFASTGSTVTACRSACN